MVKVLCAAALVVGVAGHGAMVKPRSRNSVDWLVGVNVPAHWTSDRDGVNITGKEYDNGQGAFWYSQGCFIGCAECDHLNGRQQSSVCGNNDFKGTLDPQYRTVNRKSTPGSPEDIYRHNPWRAPGLAPVGDACGLAGGTPWLPEVGEAGVYTTTKFAHHGMNGTLLKPLHEEAPWFKPVQWKIGGQEEVSWQLENNHGGGYSWRLCPAGEPLTEACFQKHQLDFVQDQQGIVFKNGTVQLIKGTFITEGTHPAGSMWAKMPIPADWLGPRCLPGPNDTDSTPNKCEKWENTNVDGPCVPCPQSHGSDCSRCDNGATPSFPDPIPGVRGCDHHHAIRDMVHVPAAMKPGKYVLNWRWDCEASAQVWEQCADIELVAGDIVV